MLEDTLLRALVFMRAHTDIVTESAFTKSATGGRLH